MPRCGGCEGVCRCTVLPGDNSISVAGAGQSAVPYELAARLSDDVGNSIELRADGLYSGAEVVAGLTVGAGLDGDGTGGDPLILAPVQASLYVANLTVPNNAPTAVNFGSEDYDTSAGGSMTTVAGRITIPTTGVYAISAGADFPTNAWTGGPEYRSIAVRANGAFNYPGLHAEWFTATPDHIVTFSVNLGCSRDIELAAGSYVELVAFQQSAGGVSREIGQAFMSARYVGPA